MWVEYLGSVNVSKYRIYLTNDKVIPVYSVSYQTRPIAKLFAAAVTNRMLAEKFIKLLATTTTTFTLLFPTKNGSHTLRVAYQKLDAVTVCESYPLPDMDKCMDSSGEAAMLSTLDADLRYWRIAIDERGRENIASRYYHGLYRCARTTFELKAPKSPFEEQWMSRLPPYDGNFSSCIWKTYWCFRSRPMTILNK